MIMHLFPRSGPTQPATGVRAVTQKQSPLPIETVNHPDPTICWITHVIAPETLACTPDAPSVVRGTGHALIECQKKLHSPVIAPAVPFAKQTLQGDAANRHDVGDIQSESDAHRPQLGSTVAKPRQQPGQLESIHQQIVRPLDPNRKVMLLQPFSHRQRRRKPQQSRRS